MKATLEGAAGRLKGEARSVRRSSLEFSEAVAAEVGAMLYLPAWDATRRYAGCGDTRPI
jgi:hypothetical protein